MAMQRIHVHYALFMKLMVRHLPVSVLSVIENVFTKCRACVKWDNSWSEEFVMKFCARQGSVLSPFMFAVYIDDIAKLCNLRVNLYIVLYVHDIMLVASTVSQLQELLYSCQHVLETLDMKINVRSFVACTLWCKMRRNYSTLGQVIPWVNEIKYLGVFIVRYRSFKCSLDAAKQSSYRAANAVFGKISRVALEEVILQLVLNKCLPMLLYVIWMWLSCSQ